MTARALQPLVLRMRQEGIDPAGLLGALGADPSLSLDPHARIPHPVFVAEWRRIEQEMVDRYLGLRCLQVIPIEFQGVLRHMSAYVVLQLYATSSNVGEGLERLARYYPILHGDAQLSLEREHDAVHVRVRLASELEAWPEAFARASRLGMTVSAGIWLSHHAHDYDDEAYKANKRKEVEALAKTWAKHPALLVWCLGNEIQLKANLPKAWKFVEELAQIIRRYDKDHPIATATAHSPPKVLDLIVEQAPSVTLLAVNSYAGLPAVTRDIGRSRYRGPFVIAEWGPNGHWETGKTAWSRPIEQTSAEKVALYRRRAKYIDSLPACLGSYVFLWGPKQERTATWYSMFVEKRPKLGLGGEATGAVDVMEEAWSKRKPSNRAPLIGELRLNGKLPGDNLVVKAPAKIVALARAADAEGDPLTWVSELLREPAQVGEAGASEARPPQAKDAVAAYGPKARATVTKPGEYRLFVYALDGKGKVGTANFPSKVE